MIDPLFRASPWVEFVGEVGGRRKDEFLGNAHAILFPINWAEPFGLVMIEAMACGTPVVAFRRGSVPEVMTDGVTGFVVDDVPEAVAAVRRVKGLSRRSCQRSFVERFEATRMARDYLAVYQKLTVDRSNGVLPVSGRSPAERPVHHPTRLLDPVSRSSASVCGSCWLDDQVDPPLYPVVCRGEGTGRGGQHHRLRRGGAKKRARRN